MKIKGFELKNRSAYDVILVGGLGGENIFVSYVKIIHDSIKRNWNWFNRFLYRWKFSPSKLLKELTEKEIIEAVRFIRIQEGAKDEDLIFIDFQLGKVKEEQFLSWLKKNKKKVETIQDITKQ